ncbi:MAG: type IX secretion system membrane protein PorP/SprF [Bacteroidota bacterium]
MKKIKITFLFLALPLCTLWSQQDPLSSQYMFNAMSYNPGVAGTSGMICATALNRQQWVGFEGAPSTTVFHVTAPVSPFRISSGVGLLIVSDNIGFNKDINLSAAYSYLMDVGMGKLGIGINLGIINKALEPAWQIPTGDGFTQATEDPLIPVNKESVLVFDAGIGAYYRADKYYAALSVTHINQPKVKFTKNNSTAVSYISRHYYITGGYNLQLPNPSLELLPSVFAYSDGKVVQFNVTSLVRYNKRVWGGVSYRAGDALAGIVGFELYNGIRIGYSYDFPLSDIRKSTSGSHEFMVNYCFDLSLGKSPMRYKSIRFL